MPGEKLESVEGPRPGRTADDGRLLELGLEPELQLAVAAGELCDGLLDQVARITELCGAHQRPR